MSLQQAHNVILVDEHDREVGLEEKLAAHQRALLHRAVSVFILNASGEMLLQKRAAGTYHSAGLWSNACCTHPYPGESPKAAAHRRLWEELGFECPIEKAFSFVYREDVGGGLTEHEFDHVFLGRYDGNITPCATEVEAVSWRATDAIEQDVKTNPHDYTPWFRICLPRIAACIED